MMLDAILEPRLMECWFLTSAESTLGRERQFVKTSSVDTASTVG